MKCIRCQGRAVIRVEHHRASFCAGCFTEYFLRQVDRAVTEERMFHPDEAVLVAVSGGKDSLALWHALVQLGYNASGLHLHLGIDQYSERSREKAERFASARGLKLHVIEIARETGLPVPALASRARRNPCSACGVVKRYLFNRAALQGGYRALATGHNLDDEAARLLGNLLHWQVDLLARQGPALAQQEEGLARRVKPLFRLTEKETAAFALLHGLDYLAEECPYSAGATSLIYKRALTMLEEASPGTITRFYLGFLKKRGELFPDREKATLAPCQRCGQPTTAMVCAYCRLVKEQS